jgi:hypothetical protein
LPYCNSGCDILFGKTKKAGQRRQDIVILSSLPGHLEPYYRDKSGKARCAELTEIRLKRKEIKLRTEIQDSIVLHYGIVGISTE